MKPPKIPPTDSIEELARFWETHDLTDCEDELEEVREPLFERRAEEMVTIPLVEDVVLQRPRNVAPPQHRHYSSEALSLLPVHRASHPSPAFHLRSTESARARFAPED